MQLRNGQAVFSPSDLNAYLECEHLAALLLGVARGEVERHAVAERGGGWADGPRFSASLRPA